MDVQIIATGGMFLLLLGYAVREAIYIRSRLEASDRENRELQAARFDLERKLQTKADANEVRKEMLSWQERVDARIRALEQIRK